jgi:hypothetical protein
MLELFVRSDETRQILLTLQFLNVGQLVGYLLVPPLQHTRSLIIPQL